MPEFSSPYFQPLGYKLIEKDEKGYDYIIEKINGNESDSGWATEYPDGTEAATYIRVIKERITKNGYGMLQSGNSNGSANMWEDPDAIDATNEDWIWHWTADAEI